MVEHVTITDPNIHEPKGVASASANQVYVADGAGSGSWEDSSEGSIVNVETAADLSGSLDSTKVYLIDGLIDMGTTQITVPSGGLTIQGFSLSISSLFSSESSYTMFTGTGGVDIRDVKLTADGTGSQVFDLAGSGSGVIDITNTEFRDCTSLGELDSYFAGFMGNVRILGGTPSLTFSGTWGASFRVDVMVVNLLDAGSYSIFTEGTSFSMSDRFFCNANVNLPTSASFCNFKTSNFTASSLLQFQDMFVSRNGVRDATDSNLTPNISAPEVECAWRRNNGLGNTHEGGVMCVTTQAATTISGISTFVDVAGTYAVSDLEHFDSPSNGQIRHLGDDPRDYWVIGQASVEGPPNDDVSIRLRKWDDSASSFVDYPASNGQVGNFTGGRDVVQIHINQAVTLDANDYLILQAANNTTTGNVTIEEVLVLLLG